MEQQTRRDIRDMAREAKFQTQLLTQQGNQNRRNEKTYIYLFGLQRLRKQYFDMFTNLPCVKKCVFDGIYVQLLLLLATVVTVHRKVFCAKPKPNQRRSRHI